MTHRRQCHMLYAWSWAVLLGMLRDGQESVSHSRSRSGAPRALRICGWPSGQWAARRELFRSRGHHCRLGELDAGVARELHAHRLAQVARVSVAFMAHGVTLGLRCSPGGVEQIFSTDFMMPSASINASSSESSTASGQMPCAVSMTS